MKAAPCSCLVAMNFIFELIKEIIMSSFSSPGTPNMYSTSSFSRHLINKSDAFILFFISGYFFEFLFLLNFLNNCALLSFCDYFCNVILMLQLMFLLLTQRIILKFFNQLKNNFNKHLSLLYSQIPLSRDATAPFQSRSSL